MTSNRPEFVVAVHAISKVGAAAVLLSPAWKARRGRARTGADRARPRRGRRAGRRLCSAELLGARPDHRPRRSPGVGTALASGRAGLPAADGAATTDEAVLVFSSGTTGLPKAVRHTHRSMGTATAHWCQALGLGPDDRFQVATPPSHILGLLNLLAAAVGRRHRAAAPPFRPRRGAALDRGRTDDPRDGGGPHRAGHGQPPRPRGLRPVLACATSCGGPRR